MLLYFFWLDSTISQLYFRNKSCRLLFMTDKWRLDKEGNLCTVHSAGAIYDIASPYNLVREQLPFPQQGDQTANWSSFKIFSASNNTIIRTSWKYHWDILKGEAENTQRNLDLPFLFYPIFFICYMCCSFVTQSICFYPVQKFCLRWYMCFGK